ncbi:MAG TPA: 50S ribosomal protein L21 [Sphingomicrobium sp.]|nr:50S ribosomal protein L21 [Sphingomicrobium sp.]
MRTGGKQYRVAPGDKIVVEKLDGNAGDRVTLGDVLLAGDGGSLKSTDGLTVAAEIIAQAKADKVTVFKKRRRHNYRRKKGHRQQHTILKIVAIGDQKEEKPAKAAAAKAPKEKPAGAITPEEGAGDIAGKPTANPAPGADEAKSTPKPAKAAGGKKSTADNEKPAAASTENAAPAKGGSKKAPKAK